MTKPKETAPTTKEETSIVPQEGAALSITLPSYINDSLEGQEEVVREKLAHVFVASPTATLIEDANPDRWGIFLPQEQLESVDFQLTKDWKQTTIVIPAKPENKKLPGYIAHQVRMLFVRRSQIEIQKRKLDGSGWEYVDLAWRNFKKTDAALAEENDTNKPKIYRYRTRNLVYFLDEDNQPLHLKPISLGFGKGVGGTTSNELKDFYKEMDHYLCQLTGRKKTTFNESIHCKQVFDVTFGLHQNEGVPFVVPQLVKFPTVDHQKVGKTETKDVKGRKWQRQYEDFGSLFIGAKEEDAEVAELITSTFEEYADFADGSYGTALETEDDGNVVDVKSVQVALHNTTDTTDTTDTKELELSNIPF